MHIDRDIKLDFKDVLIRPKRSALPSRAEVDITREFSFKHSDKPYRGVPVIAANMDTVGTFEMARALAPFGLATALHKHYGVDALVAFFNALKPESNAFYSLGITKNDLDKFERVMRRAGDTVHYVCIDVAKAFGGGADCVMLGGMLAGHDECAGEVVEQDGGRFKRFYGMSSRAAMEKYAGGVANYRASEGKEVLVPYRGPVGEAMQGILGGLRSACTYVGARTLKEFTKRTTFVRVSMESNELFGEN